jgi:hypothetical protein
MNLPFELIHHILSYSNDLDVKREFNKKFNLIKKIKNIENKEKIEYLYKNRHLSKSSYCLNNHIITAEINNLQKLKDREEIETFSGCNMNDFVDIKIYENPKKSKKNFVMTFYILKSLDTIVNKKEKSTYKNMDWVIFTVQYKI